MSEKSAKRRGRPKEEGSNRNQYRLRMSDNMVKRLNNLSQMTGKSRADIFREAFNIYENMEKVKRDNDSEDMYFDEFDDFDDDVDDDFE